MDLPTRRPISLILTIGLVGIMGVAGAANGPRELFTAPAGLPLVLAGLVTTYGVAGLVAVPGLWFLKRWGLFAMALWAGAGTAAAGIAPIAYSDDGSNRWAAVATALLLGVGLGALVRHTRRTLWGLRPRQAPPSPTP